MVRRSWPLFCLLCLISFNAIGAPLLELNIKNKTVELGNAVIAELSGVDLTRSLSDIDLSPLESNFGVVVEETSSEYTVRDSRRQLREIMLLKLYPRTVGELILPAMQFSGVVTKVSSVLVEPAILHDMPLSLDWKVSENSPWERQQVVVQVTVRTPEPFAVLASDSGRIPGIEFISLPMEKFRDSAAHSQTKLTIGWLLYPHSSGTYTIDLPVIHYEVGGLVSRRFYLPRITLHVKSLPPYIPPTMPVGKVDISSELIANTPLETGQTAKWLLTLQSAVLIPQWLPAVLRQVKSSNDIKLLPIDSERTVKPDATGANGKVVHEIAFQPLHSGTIELPSIRVQYFDPKTARLVTLKSKNIEVYAFHALIMWLTKIVVVLMLALMGWKAVQLALAYKQQKQQVSDAQKIVARADDVFTLRNSLKQYAKAMKWPENTTLSAWLACWQNQFDCNAELTSLVQELTHACYNKDSTVSLDSLREGFVAHLRFPSLLQVGKQFISASTLR